MPYLDKTTPVPKESPQQQSSYEDHKTNSNITVVDSNFYKQSTISIKDKLIFQLRRILRLPFRILLGILESSRLRTINNCLLVLLLVINVYIIFIPLLPSILHADFNAQKQQELEQVIRQGKEINSQSPGRSESNIGSSALQEDNVNSLIIPAITLNESITEGQNPTIALKEGVWRWPGGSTPDNGGNTVLAGHRFTYSDPKGVFYFLNRIKVNDIIGLTWDNYTYSYRVKEVKVVSTNQTGILEPTEFPTLTLYTCTPLWNPKDRLVVVAEQEAGELK